MACLAACVPSLDGVFEQAAIARAHGAGGIKPAGAAHSEASVSTKPPASRDEAGQERALRPRRYPDGPRFARVPHPDVSAAKTASTAVPLRAGSAPDRSHAPGGSTAPIPALPARPNRRRRPPPHPAPGQRLIAVGALADTAMLEFRLAGMPRRFFKRAPLAAITAPATVAPPSASVDAPAIIQPFHRDGRFRKRSGAQIADFRHQVGRPGPAPEPPMLPSSSLMLMASPPNMPASTVATPRPSRSSCRAGCWGR